MKISKNQISNQTKTKRSSGFVFYYELELIINDTLILRALGNNIEGEIFIDGSRWINRANSKKDFVDFVYNYLKLQ